MVFRRSENKFAHVLENHLVAIEILDMCQSNLTGLIPKFSNLTKLSPKLTPMTSEQLRGPIHLKSLTISKGDNEIEMPELRYVTRLTELSISNVFLQITCSWRFDDSRIFRVRLSLRLRWKWHRSTRRRSHSRPYCALDNATKLIEFLFVGSPSSKQDLELFPFPAAVEIRNVLSSFPDELNIEEQIWDMRLTRVGARDL